MRGKTWPIYKANPCVALIRGRGGPQIAFFLVALETEMMGLFDFIVHNLRGWKGLIVLGEFYDFHFYFSILLSKSSLNK